MEQVDFLPERIRFQRSRWTRLRRQAYLAVVCIAALAALGYVRQQSIQKARADAELLGSRGDDVAEQLALRERLERQIASLQTVKRIDEQMGSRVNVVDALAEIGKLLPRQVSLSNLSFEAAEVKGSLENSGESAGPSARAVPVSGAREQAVKRVRVMLTGLAPSDIDVANFIGQLSGSPLFEDVNMGFVRAIDFRGHTGREFQASCYLIR
jgi:Tfp pilus assembly protein PilN